MKTMDKLVHCFESIHGKTSFAPKLALVLGSGLGNFGDSVKVDTIIPYSEIEGFPVSTAPGHKGRFIFGHVANVPVVVMQGRVHYYEGYHMQDVVLPVRLMQMLGAKAVFLTNAAGGVNTNFSVGDFMLIEDHITCFVPSPLIGANIDALGTRFPDMSEVYDKNLRGCIQNAADEINLKLKNGVYMQLTGPQFETPAEIRAYGAMGADAVGMSTACEAIAARHAGMLVCGVSCITNMAAGLSTTELSGDDVNETADRVGGTFQRLVELSISKIADII